MPPTEPSSTAGTDPAATIRLRECRGCGLLQRLPPLASGATAACSRCDQVRVRRRSDPQGRALAMAVTGLCLFLLATQMPFMTIDLRGRQLTTALISGAEQLSDNGLWELSIVIIGTTLVAPFAKLVAMIWVLIGVRLREPPRHLLLVFRWVERLSPWAMVEVFLLGVFVAYTKLVDLASIELGGAVYALGALMLAMAAADMALDPEAVWSGLQRKGVTARAIEPIDEASATGEHGLIGCDCCGLVNRPAPSCARCGASLHRRKPDSLQRCLALLLAAAVLYVPANLLPVMTVISLGRGQPSTILSGVEELASSGMWPLAALVFVASITVPVLKLASLTWLLISSYRGTFARLRQRTRLYRVIEVIGRWSMIDVFMVSILTALVRMGALASVRPGPGVLSFCAVVILTMVAAMVFDTRLMWDRADAARSLAAHPGVPV
jgi:paraquat-inducible protein A